MYPLMVICVAVGVTVYMITWLIPQLEVYLQSLGKNMPPMTQNLVNVSAWLRQYYSAVVILFCGLLVALVAVYRSEEWRMAWDRFLLRIPVLGRLLKLSETLTFARSMSVMLGSGITLIDGLGTIQKTPKQPVYCQDRQ